MPECVFDCVCCVTFPLRYTFGYGRYEVISGFTNGILLVFVSLMVLGEGVSRLVGSPEIETEHLTAVAVAGFCVNLIGLCLFLLVVVLVKKMVVVFII